MTARSRGLCALLLVLFSALSATMAVYDSRQQALGLEGNALYTAEAVLVETTAARALAVSPADDLRVFVDLADGGSVRALAAGSRARMDFPVHSGRTFTSDDRGVALVGADVAVSEGPSGAVVLVGDRSYEVVGRLGLRQDSLLSDDVLVLDPDIVDSEVAGPLVLDGPDARARYVQAHGADSVETVSAATARRTNVDLVSPLVLGLGVVLVVLGWLLTGVYVSHATHRRNRVLHLLGTRAWLVRLSLVAEVTVIGVAATIVVAVVAVLASRTPVPLTVLGVGLLLQSAVVAAAVAVGTTMRRGGAR